MSGMAVAHQLQWIVHHLKIEGARYRDFQQHQQQLPHQQRQQQRFGDGTPNITSPDDVGFVIAVPTRNAGMLY
jgi:hypothetical protein